MNSKSPRKPKGPTLQEIQAEILQIYKDSDAGKFVDENRMDELLRLQEAHPDYQAYIECERQHWVESVTEFCQQCLERTRSFIPINIFETSLEDLQKLGISSDLGRRILQKQCLWLVRMSMEEISRLHESDLLGRFNSMQQHLDIIETASVYASIPSIFPVDPNGRKAEWKKLIEDNLRQMLLDNDDDTLPDEKIRNPVYNDLQYGPILDMHSVREVVVMRGEDISKPRRDMEGITLNEHGQSMFTIKSRSNVREISTDHLVDTSSMVLGGFGMKEKKDYDEEREDYGIGEGIIMDPFSSPHNSQHSQNSPSISYKSPSISQKSQSPYFRNSESIKEGNEEEEDCEEEEQEEEQEEEEGEQPEEPEEAQPVEVEAQPVEAQVAEEAAVAEEAVAVAVVVEEQKEEEEEEEVDLAVDLTAIELDEDEEEEEKVISTEVKIITTVIDDASTVAMAGTAAAAIVSGSEGEATVAEVRPAEQVEEENNIILAITNEEQVINN